MGTAEIVRRREERDGENKMKAVQLKICGIKCDNPNCDFCDMTVQLKDYKQWLNRPCPKCGHNLLTKADYKATKRLARLARITNIIFPGGHYKMEDMIRGEIEMDGSGEMEVKL